MEQLIDLSPANAIGAALLRFILAGFWIAHWWFKAGYRGMPATEAFFKQHGLPASLAWFVIRFEIVIAAGLILGVGVPLLCLASLPILFASMWIYRKKRVLFRRRRHRAPGLVGLRAGRPGLSRRRRFSASAPRLASASGRIGDPALRSSYSSSDASYPE